jgi:hypothetical protein
MRRKKRKEWLRPQVLVLRRSRPDEAVLLSCKGPNISGPGRPAPNACQHPAQGPCSGIGVS